MNDCQWVLRKTYHNTVTLIAWVNAEKCIYQWEYTEKYFLKGKKNEGSSGVAIYVLHHFSAIWDFYDRFMSENDNHVEENWKQAVINE